MKCFVLCRLYYAEVLIGRSAKVFYLDMDTGSELTWLHCDAPCRSCTSVWTLNSRLDDLLLVPNFGSRLEIKDLDLHEINLGSIVAVLRKTDPCRTKKSPNWAWCVFHSNFWLGHTRSIFCPILSFYCTMYFTDSGDTKVCPIWIAFSRIWSTHFGLFYIINLWFMMKCKLMRGWKLIGAGPEWAVWYKECQSGGVS